MNGSIIGAEEREAVIVYLKYVLLKVIMIFSYTISVQLKTL